MNYRSLFNPDSLPCRFDVIISFGPYYGQRLSFVKKIDRAYFDHLLEIRNFIHCDRLRHALSRLDYI